MMPLSARKFPAAVAGTSPSLTAHRAFTLVELLIATALSLLLVLAATTLFIGSRSIHLTQDDAIRLQDTARFAMETIGRSVVQAGFADAGAEQASDDFTVSAIAPVAGLDNRSLKSTMPALQSPVAQTVNGSDVLALHFAGSGASDEGDGSVINCAGFSVGRADPENGLPDRGWSIFYVAKDHTGEPELYCKYRGKNAWATAAIARGVESFQVLYGVGETSDSVPTHFINASQIDHLDSNLSQPGMISQARQQNLRDQTHWKKISQIKVALILRGSQAVRSDRPTQRWNVFGSAYAEAYGDSDPGVHVNEANLPLATRHRLRKLYRADFQLRHGASPLLSASSLSSQFSPSLVAASAP